MRFGFLSFALFVAAGCQSAPPPAPPPPPRMLDHATQIEMVPAGGYAFSRDGQTFIFSAHTANGMRAFSVAIAGGDPAPLTQAIGASDTRAISYFPSDDRILLRVGARLFVRQPDQTTRDIGGGDFMGWCPDSSFLAGSAAGLTRIDGADYREIYSTTLVDAAGTIAAVSRDCARAAVINQAGDVSLLDLGGDGATTRQIVQHATGTTYGVLGFTPTNRSLNYAQRQGSGFQEAYRYQLADGQTFPVMQATADVMAIEFSPTGRYGAYYTGANGRITDMALVDQASESAVPLSGGTRDLRFNRDETKIAFRLANDGWPNDIFISDLDGGHIIRLVHAPNAH